jgi:hypothetical protein
MRADSSFYFGNTAVDQIRGTGWFIGQFVPAELGLRHQTDVEVKWGVHPDGEQRPRGPEAKANRNATTISVLIHGTLRVTFEIDGKSHTVTLAKEGDYIIFGRDIGHAWEAIGHTVVLSVRFPSVEVKRATPAG